MVDKALPELAKAFGLDVKRYLPMQSGYRNKNFPLLLADNSVVNLIIYKREPGMANTIRSANRIGKFLYDSGFPARRALDDRILSLYAPPSEQYAAVYVYLPGKTIPWEAYTMAHLKSLGQTMSNMHALLMSRPQGGLSDISEVYSPIIKRMGKYFEDVNVVKATQDKLGLAINEATFSEHKKLMQISKHLPGGQPLHMDFVRSNILFAENSSEVTGVLDFEKAAYGAPVFDIARTLAFLLVDCKYKTEAQVRKYFLKSGYSKYGSAEFNPQNVRIGGQTVDLLERAIDMFLFYDFYKFLRHNPYESLHKNEHYVRTANLLVARGVIDIAP